MTNGTSGDASSRSEPGLVGRGEGGRKLIAVLHADIAGYSRLIGQDDAATVQRLERIRRDSIDPSIEKHGGQIVQTAGDSFLAVFDSVHGAVQCAIGLQQEILWRDDAKSPDQQIQYRIGINVGDVIANRTDLHGESVNVAARLQTACAPGGVCVSRIVRDHVRSFLGVDFEPLGHLTLKNITAPVEAFQWLPPALRSASPTPIRDAPAPAPIASPRRGRRASRWLIGGAFVVTIVALLSFAGAWNAGWFAQPPGAPRLSIIVLPFQNLNSDSAEDYLADAITTDLTGELSHVPGSFVIARDTAYSYKGKPVDVRKLGEELGVRYVLEGTVRKLGDTLRVNALLVAVGTGANLWSDRFDVPVRDIGTGQEEIVEHLSGALGVELIQAEAARSIRERPNNPDAFDLVLRARSLFFQPANDRQMTAMLDLYERAVRLDPSSVPALTGLVLTLLNAQAIRPDGKKGMLERTGDLLARARTIEPENEDVLTLTAYWWSAHQWRCAETIEAARRAIRTFPNGYFAHRLLGVCLNQIGKPDLAVPEIEAALRLSPHSPYRYVDYALMGTALMFLGHYGEAIEWEQRALAATPQQIGRANRLQVIVIAQTLLGQMDEAHRVRAEMEHAWPWGTIRSYIWWPLPQARFASFRDALRVVGMRDHAEEDADFGVASDNVLHQTIWGHTPTTVPGATTIRTPDLARLLTSSTPLVIDTMWNFEGRSLRGASGLTYVGEGGDLADVAQNRLRQKMQDLTKGDLATPIVAVGWSSERFDSRNLALRLVALGYTKVYWYRGGREAWEVANLPETDIVETDW
ncbi:MAG TPA: adenylate/guanylate cyclase domain-containing protein [Acetobacteraceae bacterium]|nr:adenylate/guanylate cyclase domain-containing protein [Acetobacteraceae bacterium]